MKTPAAQITNLLPCHHRMPPAVRLAWRAPACNLGRLHQRSYFCNNFKAHCGRSTSHKSSKSQSWVSAGGLFVLSSSSSACIRLRLTSCPFTLASMHALWGSEQRRGNCRATLLGIEQGTKLLCAYSMTSHLWLTQCCIHSVMHDLIVFMQSPACHHSQHQETLAAAKPSFSRLTPALLAGCLLVQTVLASPSLAEPTSTAVQQLASTLVGSAPASTGDLYAEHRHEKAGTSLVDTGNTSCLHAGLEVYCSVGIDGRLSVKSMVASLHVTVVSVLQDCWAVQLFRRASYRLPACCLLTYVQGS